MPIFAITYGFSGFSCIILASRRTSTTELRPLGVVILFVGLFNAYVEDWTVLKRLHFASVALALLVGLLTAHAFLTIRLMERLGIRKYTTAFVSSFLPVVFALALGLALVLPNLTQNECPPLAAYIGATFILLVHLPAFAFGKDRALRISLGSPLSQAGLQGYSSYLWRPFLVLGAPLSACAVAQAVGRNDWGLFGTNLIVTLVLATLFWITRPGMRTVQ